MSILELVAEVPDPELPFLTIEDLGILRSVSLVGDVVHVVITPTYSGCPAMDTIRSDIEAVLRDSGFTDVAVETVLSPAWTTDWISERGRQALADNGIAPPSAVRGPVLVALSGPRPSCPQCGSLDTEELSRFGSTACKGMWRCRSCREPFDHFKQH